MNTRNRLQKYDYFFVYREKIEINAFPFLSYL